MYPLVLIYLFNILPAPLVYSGTARFAGVCYPKEFNILQVWIINGTAKVFSFFVFPKK